MMLASPNNNRYRSAAQESEKTQAEQYWRRLVALRQRRRKGSPGAAVTVNNLGVLLVEQGNRDSAQAAEGRKLLKVTQGACNDDACRGSVSAITDAEMASKCLQSYRL